MYTVEVGYSVWRGGDYNGSYTGACKTFNFKSLIKAKQFVTEVNQKKILKQLRNAHAYAPQPIRTED